MSTRENDSGIRIGSTPERTLHISSARRRESATRRQWVGLAAVAGAAVLADQATKAAVRSSLSADEVVHVGGPLSIREVWNSGIAFGLFAQALPAVVLLTAVAVAWMLLFFARSGGRHPLLVPAIGLLVGGSFANLLDRVRLGHVTDFIDLRWWPTFNLADVSITVGVALLLVVALLVDRKSRKPLRLGDTGAESGARTPRA